MADLVFNVAKGRVAHYAALTGTNDALVAVPLEASGIVSDATMKDYDTLDAILAGASNEQVTMGRKTLASVAVAINDTDDRVEIDCANITWTAATGNAVGALVICYDPDTTVGTDVDLIPLVKLDFIYTPSGVDVTAVVAAGGFCQAS